MERKKKWLEYIEIFDETRNDIGQQRGKQLNIEQNMKTINFIKCSEILIEPDVNAYGINVNRIRAHRSNTTMNKNYKELQKINEIKHKILK